MNPLAKRPQESHWQWRSRLISIAQMERDRSEPLVTREAMRHAEYGDDIVMHVETGTRASTMRRRLSSSLEALAERNQLTLEQLCAARQIAQASEAVRRPLGVRISNVEAKVDCSGSATTALVEHIRAVQLERAHRLWLTRVRVPRAMIVEMIVNDRALKETARSYRVGWPRALRMLQDALDRWIDIMQLVMRQIDERDLEAAHLRLARAA